MISGITRSMVFTPLETPNGHANPLAERRRSRSTVHQTVEKIRKPSSKASHDPLEGLNLMAEAFREAEIIRRNLKIAGNERHGAFIVVRGAAMRLQEILTKLIALEEQ
jgi:hypothetical protein